MNPVRSLMPFRLRNVREDATTTIFSKKLRLKWRSNGVKKGFALITVLAVLIMVAVGTATVLQSVGSQTNMKSNNFQEVKAQYLAEAGMQRALWKCRTTGCIDELTYQIDGTTVAIDVTSLGSNLFTIQVSVSYTNV